MDAYLETLKQIEAHLLYQSKLLESIVEGFDEGRHMRDRQKVEIGKTVSNLRQSLVDSPAMKQNPEALKIFDNMFSSIGEVK